MAHIRQRIREDIVARLSARPEFDSIVSDSYAGALDELALPALNVATPNGEAEVSSGGQTKRVRRGDIILVQYLDQAPTGAELARKFDGAALVIEQVLGADMTLGGTVVRFILQEWETEYNPDQQMVLGQLTNEWSAQYELPDNDPEVP